MGNRSRVVAGAAAVGSALSLQALREARRRSRLNAAADGIQDAILPTHVPPTLEEVPAADEAHAPGHAHLGPPRATPVAAISDRVVRRPWTKRYRGMRHPGRL